LNLVENLNMFRNSGRIGREFKTAKQKIVLETERGIVFKLFLIM